MWLNWLTGKHHCRYYWKNVPMWIQPTLPAYCQGTPLHCYMLPCTDTNILIHEVQSGHTYVRILDADRDGIWKLISLSDQLQESCNRTVIIVYFHKPFMDYTKFPIEPAFRSCARPKQPAKFRQRLNWDIHAHVVVRDSSNYRGVV